jgi:hypothetical protein
MNAVDISGDSGPARAETDVPRLRAVLSWTAVVGLCLATGLGISAILGASLGQTATRLAGSGVACGLYGLFAVGAATLYQRSPSLRLSAVVGVLASVVAGAIVVAAEWGVTVSETVGRIALVAGLFSFALGVTGFLLSQQRDEDPRAVSRLMIATLLLAWTLTIAAAIDIVFATGSASSGPEAAGVQVPLSGLGFERFLGVTSLLTLLGILLLPLLRRAHPAYCGGHAKR